MATRPEGQIKFYALTKTNYSQALAENRIEDNWVCFIYEEGNDKCSLAIGKNIVSGGEIEVGTSASDINSSNLNAVSGKAVYECLGNVQDVIYCATNEDYETAKQNSGQTGKLLYLADDIAKTYKLAFKFTPSEVKEFSFDISLDNLFSDISDSEADNILSKLISSGARDFLLPSTEGYLKIDNVIVPADTRLKTLEAFVNTAENDFISTIKSSDQTVVSNFIINSSYSLKTSSIIGHDNIIKIGVKDDNAVLTINHGTGLSADFKGDTTIENLTINNSLTVSPASFILNNTPISFTSLGESAVVDSGSTLSQRLTTNNQAVLYAIDITGTNGLIKAEIDKIDNSITEVRTLANDLIQIGGTDEPTSTSTELWVDTSVGTNGVIKYRNPNYDPSDSSSKQWIAVNAVWA